MQWIRYVDVCLPMVLFSNAYPSFFTENSPSVLHGSLNIHASAITSTATMLERAQTFSIRVYCFDLTLFLSTRLLVSVDVKTYFLVPSSENGRFCRSPKPSVPEAGRLRRHHKKSCSPFKYMVLFDFVLISLAFSAPLFFGTGKVFLLSLPFSEFGGSAKTRRWPKKYALCELLHKIFILLAQLWNWREDKRKFSRPLTCGIPALKDAAKLQINR